MFQFLECSTCSHAPILCAGLSWQQFFCYINQGHLAAHWSNKLVNLPITNLGGPIYYDCLCVVTFHNILVFFMLGFKPSHILQAQWPPFVGCLRLLVQWICILESPKGSIFVLSGFRTTLLEAILFIHEKELILTLNRSLQNSCLHVCNYDASVINRGRSCLYGMITKALEMISGKHHVSM